MVMEVSGEIELSVQRYVDREIEKAIVILKCDNAAVLMK